MSCGSAGIFIVWIVLIKYCMINIKVKRNFKTQLLKEDKLIQTHPFTFQIRLFHKVKIL